MTREQLIEAAQDFAEESGFSGQALPIVIDVMADFAAKQLERAESVISHYADEEMWEPRSTQSAWHKIVYRHTAWSGYTRARAYFEEKKVVVNN